MAMANTFGSLCCFKRPSRGRVDISCSLESGKSSQSSSWFSDNLVYIRTAPVALGIGSFGFVLVNRALSGIPPVADASSSQSRADVLVLALTANVLLTGLVWISIQPKKPKQVELQGVECMRTNAPSAEAEQELLWAWDALKRTSGSKAMVVVYNGRCVLQAGVAAEDTNSEAEVVDVEKFIKGTLYTTTLASGKQSYLANLSLYPGRYELSFLPRNTQAVVLQPLASSGVVIVAGDKVRAFSASDQVWIGTLSEKIDATLEASTLPSLKNVSHS